MQTHEQTIGDVNSNYEYRLFRLVHHLLGTSEAKSNGSYIYDNRLTSFFGRFHAFRAPNIDDIGKIFNHKGFNF